MKSSHFSENSPLLVPMSFTQQDYLVTLCGIIHNVVGCKQIRPEFLREIEVRQIMGNMLMNKRVEETILGGSTTNNESEEQSSDYRVLPKHMYGVS